MHVKIENAADVVYEASAERLGSGKGYNILYGKCAAEKHFCMQWLKSSDVMPFFQS